jgi:hypothetical protein
VRHHVQHDPGGHGDDTSRKARNWGVAILAIAGAIAFLVFALSFYKSGPTPPPLPPRMVDVSPPDPSATYTPPPAPAPAPAYVPKVQKVARDPWADDLVIKPTFAESK